MNPHTSILLDEILDYFKEKHLTHFVDATLGAGGHAEAFLKAHPEIELLIGIDQDPVAREIAAKRLAPWSDRVRIIAGNFADLPSHLASLGIKQMDGILFDLGVSSMQFDRPEKGFSFMRQGPLDMRMDPSKSLTAAEIVNAYSEAELGRIFREYGEEKRWKIAAKAIAAYRKNKPIETTLELAEILQKAIPFTKKGINPATLVFQALRICVNGELEVLEAAIPAAIDLLIPGGLLAVISFHSLEDRIVKNAMRFAASDKFNTDGIEGVFLDKEPIVKLITKKPVIPSKTEIADNPRSRSAKLRIIEKK
jgi:16S rRNA (cytosine1402-N4)-methyltransferase